MKEPLAVTVIYPCGLQFDLPSDWSLRNQNVKVKSKGSRFSDLHRKQEAIFALAMY